MRSGKWTYVFEGDFKACFDTLDHNFILNQIKGFPYIKTVERFLKAGYIDNEQYYPNEKGTLQGGLLSPLLANIALTGLDKCLGIYYTKRNHESDYESFVTHGKYRSVRYADDFLIFAQTKEEINKVYDILEPYLEDRGLILAEDKTSITTIYDGFDFLGFSTRMENNKKCIIRPSKESVKEAKAKISNIFQMMNGHNVGELISVLNPVIDGIAEYWKPLCSSKIFGEMDTYIWKKSMKFLKRLHPNKNKGWIVSRYYPTPHNNPQNKGKWTLIDPISGNQLRKMR